MIMRYDDSAVSELQPSYDGLGNRVAQTKGVSTTYYALDVALGLPEVIHTSEGHTYLHLAGVIVTQSDTGPTRYLLSDGLGSVRHVTDETAKLLTYREYDPYGNPLTPALPTTPYAFTGEWWEADLNLLYLRARWYAPGVGVFLSVDAVESEPAYQYVGGNVVNLVDPSGMFPSLKRVIKYDDNNPAEFVRFEPILQMEEEWKTIGQIYGPSISDVAYKFNEGVAKALITGLITRELLAKLMKSPNLPSAIVAGCLANCTIELKYATRGLIHHRWYGEVGYSLLPPKVDWIDFDRLGPPYPKYIERTEHIRLVCFYREMAAVKRHVFGSEPLEDYLRQASFPDHDIGIRQ